VSVTESLALADATTKSVSFTPAESLTHTSSATSAKNLSPNQVLVENSLREITIDADEKDLVVTSGSTKLNKIKIINKAKNPSINYGTILSGTKVTIDNGFEVNSDVDDSLSEFDVDVTFSAATTFEGPTGWDGKLLLPSFSEESIPDKTTESQDNEIITTTTEKFSEITSVEIGLSNEEIRVDKPVRLEFDGDGGDKGFVTFFKKPGGSVTFIEAECESDSSSGIPSGEDECVVDDGSDIIVWTNHFTKFGTAKKTTTASTTSTSTEKSGGGGATGTGPGAGAGVGGFGGILATPLTIHEVSYDVCENNIARILIASDADKLPSVVIHTTKLGSIQATLSEDQPYEELNKITKVDKYLYEVPLDPDETFFMTVVTEEKGVTSNTVQTAVHVTECKQTIVLTEISEEEFVELDESIPRLFDIKYQINDESPQRASTEPKEVYVDDEPLTVSAIVQSITPLKRAELRFASIDQPRDEYIAIKMKTEPIEAAQNLYKISATIPPELITGPAVAYWINVLNENLIEQQSPEFIIGAKPPSEVNASIEMDIPTSKPEGTRIKPSIFVTNPTDSALFGTVSMVVDGKIVSSETTFFQPGEVQVALEWNVPESGTTVEHDVHAQINLYGKVIKTESGILTTYPDSRTVSLTATQEFAPLKDSDGNIVAQPALIYASDIEENLRFRVVDHDSHCFIGSSDECLVNTSTYDQRGGLESVKHGDIIYRVRYSGPDAPLERFSITSIDPFPPEWSVTLEGKDGLIPEASALKDTKVKVKYRTISEINTLFSE
nr:hypothetical protein [Nitrosopumilaceae archaeon]NIU00281.1 hypothetical protein [Nitrosopumilaceae archaeon]NIU86693.1 hypothetical protein [Nitrosopumilaceae archaeon]NIV65388.1 hypothetical protein [Nitrosopumilaceae archaeon]NIX60883.1 hypothetical protein [Nitrosopumilaceae archaeon]